MLSLLHLRDTPSPAWILDFLGLRGGVKPDPLPVWAARSCEERRRNLVWLRFALNICLTLQMNSSAMLRPRHNGWLRLPIRRISTTKVIVFPRLSRLKSVIDEASTPAPPERILADATEIYLNFIKLAAPDLPPTSKARFAASSRYLRFCELLLEDASMVPTRDMSLAWASAMLQPQTYLLDKPQNQPASTCWYSHQHMRLLQNGKHFKSSWKVSWPFYAEVIALWNIPLLMVGGAILGGELATLGGASESGATLVACVSIYAGFRAGAACVHGLRRYLHKSLPPRGVVATTSIAKFDKDNDGIVSVWERSEALQPWLHQYHRTADVWSNKIAQASYRVHPRVDPSPVSLNASQHVDAERLAIVMEAHDKFHKRILALGPRVFDAKFISSAVQRYAQFLDLAASSSGAVLVPTLDIDLVWHAHMCSPEDYRDDCMDILGRVLTHDANISEETLATALKDTEKQWRSRFGTDYQRQSPMESTHGVDSERGSEVASGSANESDRSWSWDDDGSEDGGACGGSCGGD